MEKLDLNSELLKPMKDQLEIILNRLMLIVSEENKEAEITLKIELDKSVERKIEDGEVTNRWVEPRITFQIGEKIKKTKNTIKGSVGEDYELKIDETTNILYVEKINEQTSMFDSRGEEDDDEEDE